MVTARRDGSARAARRRTVRAFALVATAVLLLCGCSTAFVGIGVVVVGIGVSAFAFQCDEPVSVAVWDASTAHTICDAEVVATNGKSRVAFSPCYAATLGNGTWTVTATKEGFAPATGTVTVLPEHRCTEPVRHSLELTLRGGPQPFASPPGMPAAVPIPAAPAPAMSSAPATPPTAPAGSETDPTLRAPER
jgi:hypothetical protein